MERADKSLIVNCQVCGRPFTAETEVCPYCGEGSGKVKTGTVLEILLGLSLLWPLLTPSLASAMLQKGIAVATTPLPAILAGGGILFLTIPPRFSSAGFPAVSVSRLLLKEISRRLFFFVCAVCATTTVSLQGGFIPGMISVALLLAVRKYAFFPLTATASVFLFYLAAAAVQ